MSPRSAAGIGAQEPLPGVGEQHRGAVLVEPAQLALGQQEDAAQDQGLDPVGVGDGVGQGQGRAPGAAEHASTSRRPGARAAARCPRSATRWCCPPGWRWGASLPQPRWSNSAIRHLPGIEEPPHGRVDRPARAAVQDHAGLAVAARRIPRRRSRAGRPWSASRRRRARSRGTGPPVRGRRDGERRGVAFHPPQSTSGESGDPSSPG